MGFRDGLMVVTIAVSSPGLAFATPGPDSVAVIANANIPASVELAEEYAEFRDIPESQVCFVDVDYTEVIAGTPTVAGHTINFEDFKEDIFDPFLECLGDAVDRIEAVAVMRGMPSVVMVEIPQGGRQSVSITAAIGVWRSMRLGEPLLGQAPGVFSGPYYAATHMNPFQTGVFGPGWSRSLSGTNWQPVLATMLHGRDYDEAANLIESARDAEAMEGADGEFLFMNGANSPRDLLDGEYNAIIAELTERGLVGDRENWNSNLTGRSLAALFTGSDSVGNLIEGNTYRPGALVDNMTSYGGHEVNFNNWDTEYQVSIARWVGEGVAGVHGTVDEPLANCFPSRYLIVDYVDGGTLAEAYHRQMPFLYWRNLVLGDPMLAPYAVRPEVTISNLSAGDVVGDARVVTVNATDAEGMGVDSIALYIDGVEVGRDEDDSLTACVDVDPGRTVQVLAVAQKHDDGSERGLHRPKGWISFEVTGGSGSGVCPEVGQDAGAPVTDAGTTMVTDGGEVIGDDAGTAAGDDDDRNLRLDGGCAVGLGNHSPIFLVWLGLPFLRRLRA